MSTDMKVNRTRVIYIKDYCCKPSSKASSLKNELNKTRFSRERHCRKRDTVVPKSSLRSSIAGKEKPVRKKYFKFAKTLSS